MSHPQLSRLPGAEVTACGSLSGGATIHRVSEGGRTKNTVELHGKEEASAVHLSFNDNGSVDPLWSAMFNSKAEGKPFYKLNTFVANSKTLNDGKKLGFLIYDLERGEDGHVTKAGSAMIWPPEWVPKDRDDDGKRTLCIITRQAASAVIQSRYHCNMRARSCIHHRSDRSSRVYLRHGLGPS